MIAYLQLGGESFARQPVNVTARQGKWAIVEGLAIGQRLVTRGGQAIRRSSLLATGEPRATFTDMGPLDHLIRSSIRHRVLVTAAAAVLLIVGGIWIASLPLDIFPNLSAPTVTVITEAPGMAPQEVELLVTFPIESAVNGSPGVRRLRSVSADGLSVTWAEFDWGTDIYQARQIVTERLQGVELPTQVQPPELGPVSSDHGRDHFHRDDWRRRLGYGAQAIGRDGSAPQPTGDPWHLAGCAHRRRGAAAASDGPSGFAGSVPSAAPGAHRCRFEGESQPGSRASMSREARSTWYGASGAPEPQRKSPALS